MPDKYDEAIAYLTEHPEDIVCAWNENSTSPEIGGNLFKLTGFGCGCLTEIRGNYRNGPTPRLTNAIRNDKRIPTSELDITPEHLPVFAEWQRKLDAWHAENGGEQGGA